MNNPLTDGQILPRPVERLPEYAHGKARQSLADRIIDAFALSPASASAIANAVVDPSEVRKSIGEPNDPDIEKIPVPGGTLLGVRTSVWARRLMPDPRNPRILPARRHPFAIDPGTGDEDSKFRPIAEPHPLDKVEPHKAQLAVDIESQHHLTWASQQAARYVLAENDWRKSIASQGVMEAVWLVATTYDHSDGSEPATALVTAEGSSRTTAVHDLLRENSTLEVHSDKVPYDNDESRLRGHIRALNQEFDLGTHKSDGKLAVTLRCERMPALILVGFVPHASGSTEFPTAVKSLVALRHVDPPKPWGDGPENESLADEVLDELYRRSLISATQRDYFAGSCTKAEALAARLPADPVLRAAQIVALFTSRDDFVLEAIRVAVTSQSTRKRITLKLMNDLATALILRSVSFDRSRVDQIRRYLRSGFGKSVHVTTWKSTGRATDQLVAEALAEVRRGNGIDDPGPASLELAVRGAYPLIVSGRLYADRGSGGNEQPDRRNPGEVLDAMRRDIQGVHQLGQALVDFAEDPSVIRAVDENGLVRRVADDSADWLVDDNYLRKEFPPLGKAKDAAPGDTPVDRYNRALKALSVALGGLEQAFDGLTRVVGDDGQSLIETWGVEPRLGEPWRTLLSRIDDEMTVWARAFRRMHGTKVIAAVSAEEADEADPYAETTEDPDDVWDRDVPTVEAK